jgi:predicted metalloendopeptidase
MRLEKVFHMLTEYRSVTYYENNVWYKCLFCRTLHNYMVWHLVKMMSTYLSKPFQDAKKEFLKVLSGNQFVLNLVASRELLHGYINTKDI